MWGTKAHYAIDETVCAEVDKGYLPFVKALPPRILQLAKFCIVGGTGVLVDMTVLYLLADPKTLALNITLSKVIAGEAAMLNNFGWNEIWTFNGNAKIGNTHRGWVWRLLKFNMICGVGIFIAVALLHFFHAFLGLGLYVSNLIAITLVTCWNFGMNARFNWRERQKSEGRCQEGICL